MALDTTDILHHEQLFEPGQSPSSKYGDISYFKLGRQHVYLINKPDYIEKVLVYDHGNFKKGRRLQIAKALLGEGLVTSEGDLHTRQRRIIQPIFHPKQIATYGKVMTDYASTMNKKWKDGATVDILREMMHLTLSIICKSVLNYDVESEPEEVDRALTISRPSCARRLFLTGCLVHLML